MTATDFEKDDQSAEKIKIYFSDDEKIKSFGEILTSDAGRTILKMLLLDVLSANQISQKSGISLQLVKYHVSKMQELGIVKISKIEKNCKAHDMKFYAAEKFAIMILPQNEMEKIRQSFTHSFKKFSKIAGAIIAVVSGWIGMDLSQSLPVIREVPQKLSEYAFSHSLVDQEGIEQTVWLAKAKVDIANSATGLGSGTPLISADMFWVQIIVFGGIMAVLSTVLFWKAKRHSVDSITKFR